MFCQRVRASAPAGVAPEPPGDSGRIIWGCLLAGVCACFLVKMESSTKASLRSRGILVLGSGEVELVDPSVGARRGIGRDS